MKNAGRISPLRADRLIWRFRKSGAAGVHTMPMEEFDQARRELVVRALELAVDEEPVVACIFGEHLWTLLTTKRLVWKRGSVVAEVPISEIADASVDPTDLAIAGTKESLRKLIVVTKQNEEHILELEPGAPFSGFWNMLKTVARAASER